MILSPQIIEGACYIDERGEVRYNNNFDASVIKRLYIIRNSESHPIRGWQGHQIEQRWFVAVAGKIEVYVISVDDWKNPSVNLSSQCFELDQQQLHVLHIPAGHITAIKSVVPHSMVLAMSNYNLGEVKDEYRFPLQYFKNIF